MIHAERGSLLRVFQFFPHQLQARPIGVDFHGFPALEGNVESLLQRADQAHLGDGIPARVVKAEGDRVEVHVREVAGECIPVQCRDAIRGEGFRLLPGGFRPRA